ncbi:MAG TPA: co-chaperone GroES [Phycisphaerales bacterium]|nr:co-chaperone GroES [Phycisphaerales bacterium]|tara:strand:- start:1814 stop:2128 length:315 start_codon:yes stop_codon:yes gene_type:complete
MATATKTKTSLKPLDDRIVILPNKAEEKTKSGIYIPEGAKEKPLMGKVVAVGPGKLTDEGNRAELGVKVGDIVVYGKYCGTEIDIDGDEHMICRESELLGVVEK